MAFVRDDNCAVTDPMGGVDPHRPADAYFDQESGFWKEIYAKEDVYAVLHQHRQALALSWIDSLDLPKGSSVLEVGCGAGLMSVALAQRGFRVEAVDSSSEMVEQARSTVEAAEVATRVTVRVADVHSLPFGDGTFRLLVALGVIPWLHSLPGALREMARVVEEGGGYLLASADNRRRLVNLVDPIMNPWLANMRKAARRTLQGLGLVRPTNIPPSHLHSRKEIDRLLSSVGLEKLRSSTYGFGPFTLGRRRVFSDRRGVSIHNALQMRADRGVGGLRSTGAQHLVLARRSSGGE
jgi:ubiquinone/menaquinone biosynthesis C-methylase UbiE